MKKRLHALRVSGPGCEDYRLDFGLLPRDSGPQTRTLNILRGDGGPLKPAVTGVQSQWHAFGETVSFDAGAELREVVPGQRYQLDITIRPPWPKGWLTVVGTVRLATGVAEEPEERLLFRASLVP